MPTTALLVFCACPDNDTAMEVANALVEKQLAACVSLLPEVLSVYPWKGKVESSEETILLIKTRKERYSDMEKAILAVHPYELPEIIAVPVERGLADYLSWVDACTEKIS